MNLTAKGFEMGVFGPPEIVVPGGRWVRVLVLYSETATAGGIWRRFDKTVYRWEGTA